MKYNWTLNEVASAGRENLDPAHASEYDRKENADSEAEIRLLIQLGLSETSEAVDLGAGTGRWGFMPRVARLGDIERYLVMMGRRIADCSAP